MSKSKKILIGSLIAVTLAGVGIGGKFISVNNNLITLEENIESQMANIDSKLQRRNDLIPNVVSAVKGAMKQETEVFTAIADARSKMAGAKTDNEKFEASNELSSAISRLLVVKESYPELKSNEQVSKLITELEGTENRISVERDKYNSAVKDYNTALRKFPNSLFANIAGHDKKEYFEASKGAEIAPEVNLVD